MPYPTIIMLLVMGGMLFFMQHQQKKRAQERQNQMNQLQKGDEIVTIGGLYALVDEVDSAANKVVLDVDGVYLTYELTAIKQVLPKASSDSVTTDEEKSEPVIETAIEE